MGHQKMFFEKPHWRFRYNHGGSLRQKRRGRKARPISNKTPIHLVFKADRTNLKRGFRSPLGFLIATDTLKKYSKKFFVKIEQAAICQDHIHLIVRFSKRSQGLNFLRVFSGQVAQQFRNRQMVVTDTHKLWKFRPFSRVVIGRKAFSVLRNYVRLNHLESIRKIAYRKERLRGLLPHEYGLLWS